MPIAAAQLTEPLATLMTTGTFAPVRVVPQVVPVEPGGGAVWAAAVHAASPARLVPATASAARRRIVFTCSSLPVAPNKRILTLFRPGLSLDPDGVTDAE